MVMEPSTQVQPKPVMDIMPPPAVTQDTTPMAAPPPQDATDMPEEPTKSEKTQAVRQAQKPIPHPSTHHDAATIIAIISTVCITLALAAFMVIAYIKTVGAS